MSKIKSGGADTLVIDFIDNSRLADATDAGVISWSLPTLSAAPVAGDMLMVIIETRQTTVTCSAVTACGQTLTQLNRKVAASGGLTMEVWTVTCAGTPTNAAASITMNHSNKNVVAQMLRISRGASIDTHTEAEGTTTSPSGTITPGIAGGIIIVALAARLGTLTVLDSHDRSIIANTAIGTGGSKLALSSAEHVPSANGVASPEADTLSANNDWILEMISVRIV